MPGEGQGGKRRNGPCAPGPLLPPPSPSRPALHEQPHARFCPAPLPPSNPPHLQQPLGPAPRLHHRPVQLIDLLQRLRRRVAVVCREGGGGGQGVGMCGAELQGQCCSALVQAGGGWRRRHPPVCRGGQYSRCSSVAPQCVHQLPQHVRSRQPSGEQLMAPQVPAQVGRECGGAGGAGGSGGRVRPGCARPAARTARYGRCVRAEAVGRGCGAARCGATAGVCGQGLRVRRRAAAAPARSQLERVREQRRDTARRSPHRAAPPQRAAAARRAHSASPLWEPRGVSLTCSQQRQGCPSTKLPPAGQRGVLARRRRLALHRPHRRRLARRRKLASDPLHRPRRCRLLRRTDHGPRPGRLPHCCRRCCWRQLRRRCRAGHDRQQPALRQLLRPAGRL